MVGCDNPLVYTGLTISKLNRESDGKIWYTLSLDQRSDIIDFLDEHNMSSVRHTDAPMPHKSEIYSDTTPLSDQDHATYRSLIGSLVWFTQTRWDIAHDINRLSHMKILVYRKSGQKQSCAESNSGHDDFCPFFSQSNILTSKAGMNFL